MMLNEDQNPKVRAAFEKWPPLISEQLYRLRALILEAAAELEEIGEMEETLKWGEPSYLVKGGSTVRLGWKPERGDNYFMYFHCQTKLVPTFRELYSEQFDFEGNRAIIFEMGAPEHTEALKHCIKLALSYHRVKHLPMLGATAT